LPGAARPAVDAPAGKAEKGDNAERQEKGRDELVDAGRVLEEDLPNKTGRPPDGPKAP